MTKIIGSEDAFLIYRRRRVRVMFNPQTDLWNIYPLASQEPHACIKKLTLVYASVYGDLRPDFAPNGTPSFIGDVSPSILDMNFAERVYADRCNPAKLYTSTAEGNLQTFVFGRYLLIDGPNIFTSEHFTTEL